MQRIVIADPNELLSLRMSGLVSRADGFEVVGTAPDCSTALELYAAHIPTWSSWTSSCHRWVALPSSPPSTTPCQAPVFVLVGEAQRPQAAYAAGALASSRRTDRFNTSLSDLGWSGGRPLPRVSTLWAAPGAASVNDDRFTTAGA